MPINNATTSRTTHEQLWRSHAAELVRYATLLVGPDDAQDVVSSAFIKVARNLPGAEPENLRSYLFRAVTNEAHDHHRRDASRHRRDSFAVRPSASPASDTDVDVRRAVDGLSLRQRAVVYLAYWEDLPERTIAKWLDISVGSVRRHLTRAQSHLRKALHEQVD